MHTLRNEEHTYLIEFQILSGMGLNAVGYLPSCFGFQLMQNNLNSSVNEPIC